MSYYSDDVPVEAEDTVGISFFVITLRRGHRDALEDLREDIHVDDRKVKGPVPPLLGPFHSVPELVRALDLLGRVVVSQPV